MARQRPHAGCVARRRRLARTPAPPRRGVRLLSLALLSALLLACHTAAEAASALIIWDANDAGTQALKTALEAAGITVTLSATTQALYDGTNPAPDAFNAVIHLNAQTYSSPMAPTAQDALVAYVQDGGGFLHAEWSAFAVYGGYLPNMVELTLFEATASNGTAAGPFTMTDVVGQETHPVLANVPSPFAFTGAVNAASNARVLNPPVTVLMTEGSNDAVAVREFGAGRIVGFHHAANWSGGTMLQDSNIQQLYIDGVFWAAGSTTPPTASWSAPFERLGFDGVDDHVTVTNGAVHADTSLTIETWFRTTGSGVVFGYQTDPVGTALGLGPYTPALYVGSDGFLRGGFWMPALGATPITTSFPVDDDVWRHAALVASGDQDALYIDGELVGVRSSPIDHLAQLVNQVGVGYTDAWPGAAGGWHYFSGDLSGFTIWDGPLPAADIGAIASVAPSQTLTWSHAEGSVQTFDGVDDLVTAPVGTVQSDTTLTVETWFRTRDSGVIFGYQDAAHPNNPSGYVPALYIGSDGFLRGGFATADPSNPIASPGRVDNGQWWHAALVANQDRHLLYLDGALIGTVIADIAPGSMTISQVGAGYASGWAGAQSGWFFYRGDLADFNIWLTTLPPDSPLPNTVPTPTTLTGLALVGLLVAGRPRRTSSW